MPVSLPRAFTPADVLGVPVRLDRRSGATGRIANWLETAKQRRAERLLAQSICAAGIRDFSAHRD